MRQRGERGALHFDVDDAGLLELGKVIVLLVLAELAEGSVEATLALVKVRRAHRLADYCIVRIFYVCQRLQLAYQLLVQERRPTYLLAEDVLRELRFGGVSE